MSGHVDINDAVQQTQRFYTIVPSSVVDQWQVQASLRGNLDCGEDLRDHMARANQINIVATPLLKIEHHGGDLLRLR
jgi:hypothetical protein